MSDDITMSSVDSSKSIGFERDDITLSSKSARDDSTPQNQERVADDSAVITNQRANQRKTGKPIDGGQSAQNQQISTINGVLVALEIVLRGIG